MTTLTTPTTVTPNEVARGTRSWVGWVLAAGGVFIFVGGPMHPKEDPPNVTVMEHMRIMFTDPLWYPAHIVLLIGMALLAAALVGLVRGRSLIGIPRLPLIAAIAAVATAAATPGMLLHLIAAVDAGRIAAHQVTPTADVQVVVETITVPAFGFSIAALAFVGATTRALGNLITAIPGVLGGLGYGLAGATFLFTDKLDFLFPTAAGIAVWAIAVGVELLLRRRTAAPA
jgi:hypothetical protein